jgi:protein-tyrosine phosphatase
MGKSLMSFADPSEYENEPEKKVGKLKKIQFFGSRRESKKRARSLNPGGNNLVLCRGNICRSPVVETLLNKSLPDDLFKIRSRGLLPLDPQPSPTDYAKQAKSLGVDLSGHYSCPVSHEDISWATVILIMDNSNREGLRRFGDMALSKVVWIGAWDPSGDLVIPDPFREPPQIQRQIITRMKQACSHFTAWLLHPVSRHTDRISAHQERHHFSSGFRGKKEEPG